MLLGRFFDNKQFLVNVENFVSFILVVADVSALKEQSVTRTRYVAA